LELARGDIWWADLAEPAAQSQVTAAPCSSFRTTPSIGAACVLRSPWCWRAMCGSSRHLATFSSRPRRPGSRVTPSPTYLR